MHMKNTYQSMGQQACDLAFLPPQQAALFAPNPSARVYNGGMFSFFS
uniref:Uncharacterized protein n=1 Tax=Aegilops tauschii subsp. strangulata TaxID=200361 RepID=A0A453JFP8_AEGTS